ncbi:MAG: hypothetical protein HY901_09695, partial [Deltaproteobacteria bacterium]|nr:hypothetical protein [Deltaproteobacteria bacterium]
MEPARQHLLPSEPDGGELLDGKQLREWTSYALGSLRRHGLLASAAAAVVLAAAALSLVALPRTWHVEVLMLASRNEVLTSLSNPRRSVPRDAEAPTRSAQETVLAHDNLLQLVEQTRLQQRWEQTRPPLLKLKDWVADRVVGPPTAQKKLDALLGLL